MKDDTHPQIKKTLQDRYRNLSGEERVEMATSMFDCAREIVIQSLRNTNSLMTEQEIRKAVFLRFYGELPDFLNVIPRISSMLIPPEEAEPTTSVVYFQGITLLVNALLHSPLFSV